ncbi:MAG: Fic family protein [Lachnospiraceae bacterium]|nr:Fic family protein [Lachnospiraceae bacterium]
MSRLTEILEEYKGLGIPDQIDYDKLYLYSIITHSTAVEGSTVTEIENRLLFDEGISPGKSLTEQFMNLDLKRAYEEAFIWAEQHRDYSVELLCRLSGMVMKNTGSEYKTMVGNFSSANGDLRLLNVTAGRGGKSYMSYQKVPQRLEDFCSWLNTQRKSIASRDTDRVYELSFMAHYNLVYIHPWADGNGRMSRLVMNMIQMEFGVVPSIVKKESREEYIKSLAESQDKGEAAFFLEFMLRHHVQNLEEAVSEYKKSIDDDTLNLKNDTLNDTKNDTLNLSAKETVVYDVIKEDNYISIEMIMAKTGFSRPTVTRAISTLKKKQVLDRIGSKKNGHWIVKGDYHVRTDRSAFKK